MLPTAKAREQVRGLVAPGNTANAASGEEKPRFCPLRRVNLQTRNQSCPQYIEPFIGQTYRGESLAQHVVAWCTFIG